MVLGQGAYILFSETLFDCAPCIKSKEVCQSNLLRMEAKGINRSYTLGSFYKLFGQPNSQSKCPSIVW